MNSIFQFNTLSLRAGLAAVLLLALTPGPSHAANFVNGGFEAGLSGWTSVNQSGSGSGSWFSQTGTVSPLNAFTVPVPPQGTFAAMTDQIGSGSHILYQDIAIDPGAILSLQLYINNQATAFFTPSSLDFNVPPNQQFRIDLLSTSTTDFFGAASTGLLQNLYITNPGSPLTSGYQTLTFDLSAFAGQTTRLAFREVDNQFFFQVGIDDVALTSAPIPEPSSLLSLVVGGLLMIGLSLHRSFAANRLTSTPKD